VPYSASSDAAVFGNALRARELVDGSPRRAMKSGTCAGSTPYRSLTCTTPIRASSETPFTGWSTVVRSLTSWNASRSEVATTVSPLRASSWATAAARKSSPRTPAPSRAEAHRPDELGEQVELLEQLRVEDAAALVRGERLAPVRRLADAVPADEHGPRLLHLPEPEQEVREADDRARRQAGRAAHGLRQRVIGAVGEGVAVDRESGRPLTVRRGARRSASIKPIRRLARRLC